MKKVSLFVQTHNLASRPESRVDCKHTFLSHRRGKQKLAEILSKYTYGLYVGLLLCLFEHFV